MATGKDVAQSEDDAGEICGYESPLTSASCHRS